MVFTRNDFVAIIVELEKEVESLKEELKKSKYTITVLTKIVQDHQEKSELAWAKDIYFGNTYELLSCK